MNAEDGDRRIPRRTFLKQSVSAAGSLMLSNPLIANASTAVEPKQLASDFGFKGRIILPGSEHFNQVVFGRQWNQLLPKRHPQMVAEVTNDDDVVAAIKFARANKMKVAVRGGGHNWSQPAIRDGGMMIDLTNLNQVISLDAKARKAVVQPIISNRDIQAHLNAHGLSYPSGHCPPVKLSGYLLSGGMSWNQGSWGHGCESVEAIELVNAQGEKLLANAEQNQDYFWAARGAGPNFFAVATRYHLKLYPLPKAITASVYFYPYEHSVKIAEWLGPLAAQLPSSLELSQFVIQAPPDLAEKTKSANGKVCLVTATMFADSADEAKETLKLLDSCPLLDTCLSKSVNAPTDFPSLFDASGALWPGDLRCKVDAMFFDAPLADLFKATHEHFLSATPKTVLMWAVFTGKNVPAPLPDAAFSMSAKLYGGPWTMWDDSAGDANEIAWHYKCVDLLKPYVAGHYVAESDTIVHPEYNKGSYKEQNWAKLNELRKKYDPDELFAPLSV